MGLTLEKSNIVVVGAWNPGILQPDWLLKQGVLEGGEIRDVMVDMMIRQFRFRFSVGDLAMRIQPDRIVIESGNSECDCGKVAAHLLQLLPHTPVTSIGANFVSSCPAEDWPAKCLPSLERIELSPESRFSDIVQLEWSAVRGIGDFRAKISVLQRKSADIGVSVNIHRTVESAGKAAEHALNWAHIDRPSAFEIVKEMFHVETYGEFI